MKMELLEDETIVEQSKKKIKALLCLTDTKLGIKWRFSYMCNYKCPYCIQGTHDKDLDLDLLKEQENVLTETAKKISDLIERSQWNSAKIELVGGEVTIYDLKKILGQITSDKLKRIAIVSNMSQSAEWYISLYDFLKERGVELGLTGSYHDTETDLETFIEKAAKINEHFKLFKVETVSTVDNQDMVKAFQKKCIENNLDYIIENDRRWMYRHDYEIFSLISKPGKKKDRYRLITADGETRIYTSRFELTLDNEIEDSVNNFGIDTRVSSLNCSQGWDYVYVEYDKIKGRCKENNKCNNVIAIENYEFIEPKKCFGIRCSMCGHMSLFSDEGRVYYNQYKEQ